jgi:CRP/FNR family transcriptional regulator, cyclic AMP receptor protein
MRTAHETMNQANLSSNLKGEFFKALPADALADFEGLLAPTAYPAGMVIFSETQPCSGVYVVLDGEVKLSINSADGHRLSFCIAKAGEVLGLSAAISGGAYEMTADVLYPAKIAHISRPVYLEFLSRYPAAYQVVAREMARTYSTACEQLRMVGLSTSVPERLARLLLVWSNDPDREPERPARCRLSLTHEQIGEFIGTSRETVTRTLTSFKNRRLVAQHGSMLTIPSRLALESYARV